MIEFAPVDATRWNDFADLMTRPGPRGGGGPGTFGCWCMWWRDRQRDGAVNRDAIHDLICSGEPVGLLAYDDGDVVGWVSIAPRAQHGQLLRSRTYAGDAPVDTWVLSCLYIAGTHRRRGLAGDLVAAAVDHAARQGARHVDAYPAHKPDYMGRASTFAKAGFVPLLDLGSRTLMRRTLTRTGGAPRA